LWDLEAFLLRESIQTEAVVVDLTVVRKTLIYPLENGRICQIEMEDCKIVGCLENCANWGTERRFVFGFVSDGKRRDE
jgi:hypothetical protein